MSADLRTPPRRITNQDRRFGKGPARQGGNQHPKGKTVFACRSTGSACYLVALGSTE